MSLCPPLLFLKAHAAPPAGLLVGLLAYYKLDSDATDSTGTNTGTASNVTFSAGQIGNAAEFTSIASTVVIPAGNLNITGDLTISAWVYATDLGNYYTIVAHMIGGGGANVNYHLITFPGGSVQLHGTGDTGVSGVVIGTGVWTHLVATRTTTGYTELYKDGVLTATGTGPTPTSFATDTRIGCRGDAYSHWHGKIDEVGIWNRVLTSGEVSDIYNAGAGLTYPF